MTYDNGSGRVFWGVVAGAAAGALIGMLLAPEKGTQMRNRISSAANDFADEFMKTVEKGKQEADNLKNKVAGEAERLKNQAYNKGEHLKDQAQEEYRNLKDTGNEQL
jgi:gas vesicle protein